MARKCAGMSQPQTINSSPTRTQIVNQVQRFIGNPYSLAQTFEVSTKGNTAAGGNHKKMLFLASRFDALTVL
jgi:hypothetical protein